MMPSDPNMPKVGDRVKVVGVPHVEGHDEGIVRQALHGALGIEFDAAVGEVHHWYVPTEVMVIEAAPMPLMEEMDRATHATASVAVDSDECRTLLCPVELRAQGDEGSVLEGYAAVFNEWTQVGPKAWGFMERVAPGAFAQTIREDDILATFNHNFDQMLGRTSSSTLQLSEDTKGLRAVITPPDTSVGRDVVTVIKRGDVKGMSFMFRVRKDLWEDDPDNEEMPRRTLLDVRLIEAGPVSLPAYPQTTIAVRDHVKAWRAARAQRAQTMLAGNAIVADRDQDRARWLDWTLRHVHAGR